MGDTIVLIPHRNFIARVREAQRLLYGEGMVGSGDAMRDAAQRLACLIEDSHPHDSDEDK